MCASGAAAAPRGPPDHARPHNRCAGGGGCNAHRRSPTRCGVRLLEWPLARWPPARREREGGGGGANSPTTARRESRHSRVCSPSASRPAGPRTNELQAQGAKQVIMHFLEGRHTKDTWSALLRADPRKVPRVWDKLPSARSDGNLKFPALITK